jgi:outer membrane usher protein
MPRGFSTFLARSLLLVLATSVIASPVAAEPSTFVLPLVLNQVPRGNVLVIEGAEGIELRVADLTAAGLERYEGRRRMRQSEEWVVLGSIEGLQHQIDYETLTLRLEASTELLPASVRALRGGSRNGWNGATTRSAFLNYAINGSGWDEPALSAEAGASIGRGFGYTTVNRAAGGELIRGLTQVVLDEPARMRRWTVGDARLVTDVLGGGDLIGGVTVTREFSLQPYFVRYPSIDFEGAAASPSTVEIYVNGLLVQRQNVAPGTFRLEGLPVTAGSGETQIVVRDAYGREQTFASPYYASTLNLGRGISEFTYSAGFRREGFGRENFEYGEPVFVAHHRLGLTSSLTVGGRFEATDGLVSGGVAVTAATRVGELEANLAASDAAGGSGSAAAATYRYVTRKGSFGGRVRVLSDRYANLSLAPEAGRIVREQSLFASRTFGRAGLSAMVALADPREGERESRLSASGSYAVNRQTSLFFSAGVRESGGTSAAEAFAGVSLFLGRAASASGGLRLSEDSAITTVDVQKSLPVGTGYGYRLQSRGGDGSSLSSGALQYQGPYGRYEISASADDLGAARYGASGGLVWVGGRLLASRAVQESFALARVGVPGVRVLASNLEVGRTDRRGDLLIPNLLPYYDNRISIDQRDVPLKYEVGAVEETFAPAARAGGVVSFPVQKIRTIVGRLRVEHGDEVVIPEFGQLTIRRGSVEANSPLGRDGTFYLENIDAGSYDAAIITKRGICRFTFPVPESEEQMVSLGVLTCRLD